MDSDEILDSVLKQNPYYRPENYLDPYATSLDIMYLQGNISAIKYMAINYRLNKEEFIEKLAINFGKDIANILKKQIEKYEYDKFMED